MFLLVFFWKEKFWWWGENHLGVLLSKNSNNNEFNQNSQKNNVINDKSLMLVATLALKWNPKRKVLNKRSKLVIRLGELIRKLMRDRVKNIN